MKKIIFGVLVFLLVVVSYYFLAGDDDDKEVVNFEREKTFVPDKKPVRKVVFIPVSNVPDVDIFSELPFTVSITQGGIIVYGSDADILQCREIVETLDIEPYQYVIEAVLTDVILNDDVSSGVSYVANIVKNLTNVTDNIIVDTISGRYQFIGVDSRIIVDALSKIQNIEIKNESVLSCMVGKTASLAAGESRPVLTGSQRLETTTENITYDYKDIGIGLRVSPLYGSNEKICKLEIEQLADNVIGSSLLSGAEVPIIQNRGFKSVLSVAVGSSVVLGGVRSSTSEKTKTGVPVLKDVPYLGRLFSVTSNVEKSSELVLILTVRLFND